MAEEMKVPLGSPAEAGQQPPQQQQQIQIPVDASDMSSAYANFFRVTGTPEELVLDFGLNTQMTPTPTEPIKLTHRVVMNFYTAKRLLGALHGVVTQHEAAYGVLELDFNRRARGGGMPGQRPGQAQGIRPAGNP